MTGPLVVVGDALLDVHVDGTAERLCPEAPVPVVDVDREWQRPGGAGLAALLAARSAPEVVLVTAIGADESGARLLELLAGEVEVRAWALTGPTPRKTRVRAAGQPVVRLDHGSGRAGRVRLSGDVLSVFAEAAVILVADYGRGVAAHPQIRHLLSGADAPVVWDPHSRGAAPVPGSRLITPNEAEAARFAAQAGTPADAAVALRRQFAADGVAVTLGSRGALLACATGVRTFPVPGAARVPVSARPDTCGAGDRFASAAAAALLDGADLPDAVSAAVGAAARFVAAGAASTVSALVGEHASRVPAG